MQFGMAWLGGKKGQSMADIPSLLIHPKPYKDEGPQGYLFRLASENFITLSDLKNFGITYDYEFLSVLGYLPNMELDPSLHQSVQQISIWRKDNPRVWNERYARYCPHCLAENNYWRVGWELMFFDACPIHDVMLVDRCSSCAQHLKWNRDSLIRCQCGADLRMEEPVKSNPSSSQLSQVLFSKLLGHKLENLPIPVALTNLAETQQLIRYLGACLRPGVATKPLKIREAAAMSVSWSISTYAAEIIFNWPTAFEKTLNQLQEEPRSEIGRSMKNAFGWAFQYLYRAMQADTFEPIRQAFNLWLVLNWQGGVARRNSRLLEPQFALVEWLPGGVVCNELGITLGRLRRLVQQGQLEAQEYISEKGRKFLMVRKDQIDVARKYLSGGMSIEEAGWAIGLTRKRMRAILRILFPNAIRENNLPVSPWYVPRSDVDEVLKLREGVPVVSIQDEDCVTANHILRYWPWEIMDIVGLIETVKEGEIKPVSRVEGFRGISGLAFKETELRQWRQKRQQVLGTWLTVPQISKAYGIRQQTLYQLIERGFIVAEKLPTVRNGGHRIHRNSWEAFRKQYIFATEINERLGTVTLKLIQLLKLKGINPISGPEVDGCRRVLYKRSDEIEQVILAYLGKRDGGFELM